MALNQDVGYLCPCLLHSMWHRCPETGWYFFLFLNPSRFQLLEGILDWRKIFKVLTLQVIRLRPRKQHDVFWVAEPGDHDHGWLEKLASQPLKLSLLKRGVWRA